jgi:hypothetical protein
MFLWRKRGYCASLRGGTTRFHPRLPAIRFCEFFSGSRSAGWSHPESNTQAKGFWEGGSQRIQKSGLRSCDTLLLERPRMPTPRVRGERAVETRNLSSIALWHRNEKRATFSRKNRRSENEAFRSGRWRNCDRIENSNSYCLNGTRV